MKNNRKGFLIALLLFLLLAAFLFIAYKLETFAFYNEFVDNLFLSDKEETEGRNSENESSVTLKENVSLPPLSELEEEKKLAGIDLTGKNLLFAGIFDGDVTSNSSDTPSPVDIMNNGYSLKTDFFNYVSKWKFISPPYYCNPYIAVFTGEPELLIFDRKERLKYSCPVAVFPDRILEFNSERLVFTGRDGNSYYFVFRDSSDDIPEPIDPSKTPKQFFVPDEKCQSAIMSRLEMWTDKEIEALPPLSFFPAADSSGNVSAEYDISTGLSVYTYSPLSQGRYKVGFMDQNGNWSDYQAFVFVFLSDGEMLNMSFEYYADRPYVETSLSDNELYYFVFGSITEGEIPEKTLVGVKGPLS
ncbi:MAG: hypothetical protein K5930_04550 [Treponemataceae bacterium]|nr:hypothetical protein [Treponemataceae bacterium]